MLVAAGCGALRIFGVWCASLSRWNIGRHACGGSAQCCWAAGGTTTAAAHTLTYHMAFFWRPGFVKEWGQECEVRARQRKWLVAKSQATQLTLQSLSLAEPTSHAKHHQHLQDISLVPAGSSLQPAASSMVDVENVSRDLPAAQDESPSKKAKTTADDEGAAADAQPSRTQGKFKIVGRVVMAMKRFQGGAGHACVACTRQEEPHRPLLTCVPSALLPLLQRHSTPPIRMASAHQTVAVLWSR